MFKTKTVRLLSLSLAAMLAVGSLAGCGQQSPSSASAAPDSVAASSEGTAPGTNKKEPVTITAMITQSRNYDGLKNMIKKLEAEENITIDCQVVPDDQYQNMMIMKFNSGEIADIVDYNIPDIYNVVDPEKFMADLSAEPWVANMIKPENVQKNGKIYGFPFQTVQGVHGLVYNKDVFDKLGLSEPKSWDEFLTICETIKTKGEGVVPFHLPKDGWVPQIIVADNMAKALGKQGLKDTTAKLLANELTFPEVPAFEQVINHYLDLFAKGYINDDYLSASYDDCIAAVGTGKAAMSFNGDFFAASIMEAYPDTKLGMCNLKMPTAQEDYITANIDSIGFVANKNSKNLETVKRVFQAWSTPDYADLYFASRPGFPAFKDVNGGPVPYYLETLNNDYISKGNFDAEINYYMGVGKNAVSNYLWIYYLEGPAKKMTGAQVLEKFQPDYAKYMKENKQPGF